MVALRKKIAKIKTMTNHMNSRVSGTKACISVAALELEKQRHTRELMSLLQRVVELNTRLKEITARQASLSKLFLEESQANESVLTALMKKDKLKLGPAATAGIFKIKY